MGTTTSRRADINRAEDSCIVDGTSTCAMIPEAQRADEFATVEAARRQIMSGVAIGRTRRQPAKGPAQDSLPAISKRESAIPLERRFPWRK